MDTPRHTVAETATFQRTAKQAGLTAAQQAAIVDQVAADPAAGDLVQGSGGVRKIRYGGSGGYRIMVAYFGPDIPAYLIAVLSKSARSNFTDTEVNAMHAVTKAIKHVWKGR